MALKLLTLFEIAPKCTRHFHCSVLYQAKAAKTMKKILGSSHSKRRVYCDTPILPTPDVLMQGANEGKYSGNSKRATVLNKMFMRYITDLMATGENAADFVGHGIEINRVQITPDFKGLNVFWVAKGAQSDNIVEDILKKNAGYLRHELSTLRVMGAVPRIHFVKDKKSAEILEIDCRLAKADFGEDHMPVEMAAKLRTQLELYTPLDPNIKQKIQELDEQDLDDVEDPLPSMPQDVLGLNHADILQRIQKSMKKSEAVHRLSTGGDNEELALPSTINENPIEFGNSQQRREAFRQFLEKRELLRSKARKLDKNYIPDVEYMREESLESQQEYFNKMDVYEKDLNDYLYEDYDK